MTDPLDRCVLEDLHTALACATSQRHRRVGGVAAPILGIEQRSRPDRRELSSGNFSIVRSTSRISTAISSGLLTDACRSELFPSVGVGRQVQRAGRLPAGRQTGVGLERLEDLDAALHDLAHARGRACRRDQPGRVPCRARRELVALEQHDVGPSPPGEVVGDAAADDTSADDHDSGAARQSVFHASHSGRST